MVMFEWKGTLEIKARFEFELNIYNSVDVLVMLFAACYRHEVLLIRFLVEKPRLFIY